MTEHQRAIYLSLIAASQERQEEAEQRQSLQKFHQTGTSQTADEVVRSPKPDNPAIIPDRAAPAR